MRWLAIGAVNAKGHGRILHGPSLLTSRSHSLLFLHLGIYLTCTSIVSLLPTSLWHPIIYRDKRLIANLSTTPTFEPKKKLT